MPLNLSQGVALLQMVGLTSGTHYHWNLSYVCEY